MHPEQSRIRKALTTLYNMRKTARYQLRRTAGKKPTQTGKRRTNTVVVI